MNYLLGELEQMGYLFVVAIPSIDAPGGSSSRRGAMTPDRPCEAPFRRSKTSSDATWVPPALLCSRSSSWNEPLRAGAPVQDHHRTRHRVRNDAGHEVSPDQHLTGPWLTSPENTRIVRPNRSRSRHHTESGDRPPVERGNIPRHLSVGESPEQIAESARQPKGLIPIIPRKRPASPLLPGYGGHEMEHDRDVACAVPQMCLQRTTGAGGTPDVPFGVPLAASSAATVRQRSGRRIPPPRWQGARLGTGHKVRKLREFVKHLIDGTDVDREMSPNTGTRPLFRLALRFLVASWLG